MRDSKLFCDDGRTRGPAPTGNDDVFDLGLKKENIISIVIPDLIGNLFK